MANYQLLKADIDERVYENARQKITGANLNYVLNQMVTTLGAEYQFAGVATKDTNPGTPDAKVFYIANGKGTYTNFGSLEVTEDEVVILYWDSSWHKVATGIASNEKLTELDSQVTELDSQVTPWIGGDDVLHSESMQDGTYEIDSNNNVFFTKNRAGYKTCSPIDISNCVEDTDITIKSSIVSVVGVYLCDENMVALDYINANNAKERGYNITSEWQDITVKKTANAKYIVSSLRDTYNPTINDFDVRGTIIGKLAQMEEDIESNSKRITETDTKLTELDSQVTELEREIINKEEYKIQAEELPTPNIGKKLQNNGVSITDADYNIIPYAVTDGDLIRIISPFVYEFMTVKAAQNSTTNYEKFKVGDAVAGNKDIEVIVPVGAKYVLISQLVSGSKDLVFKVTKTSIKEEIESNSKRIIETVNSNTDFVVSANTYDSDDLSDGYYELNSTTAANNVVYHTNYKCLRIPVISGCKYLLKSVSLIHPIAKSWAITDIYRTILRSSDYEEVTNISETFIPSVDGYLYINITKGNYSSFSLKEYAISKSMYVDLKDYIKGSINMQSIQPSILYDNYYITLSGTRAENNSYAITEFIKVNKGEYFTITAKGTNSVAGLSFSEIDNFNNPVTPLVVFENNVNDYTVIIPNNGYIVCSYLKNIGLSLTRYTKTNGIIDNINGTYLGESVQTTTVLTNQYYLNYRGILSSRTNGDYNVYNFIKVNKGDKVYVSGYGSGSNVCLLGFKDSITDGSLNDFRSPVKVLVKTINGYAEETILIQNDGYITGSYRSAANFVLKINEAVIIGIDDRVTMLESKVENLISKVEINEENPIGKIITDGGSVGIFTSIAQIGDSLASGEMAYADSEDESAVHYIDMYEQSWMSFIGRVTGRKVFNFSVGGASTKSFLAAKTLYPDTSYVVPIEFRNQNIHQCFLDNPCQAYFIALGHNDRNIVIRDNAYTSAETAEEKLAIVQAAIGTPKDIARNGIVYEHITDADLDDVLAIDTDTYYVRYAKVIAEIKKIQPYAKIFPVCMKTGLNPNSIWEIEGWNNAIRYMAKIFTDIYIIDMGKWGTVPSWHYTQGHGNAMGYQALANEYMTYADWIIRNNRDYFKYTSFIGDTNLQSLAITNSSRGSVGSTF